MTYFRTGSPYYHRRAAVSRSCSGWEGVVPAGYGRQALTVVAVGGLLSSDFCLLTSNRAHAVRKVIGSSCTGN
jgi:hypothetical protein